MLYDDSFTGPPSLARSEPCLDDPAPQVVRTRLLGHRLTVVQATRHGGAVPQVHVEAADVPGLEQAQQPVQRLAQLRSQARVIADGHVDVDLTGARGFQEPACLVGAFRLIRHRDTLLEATSRRALWHVVRADVNGTSAPKDPTASPTSAAMPRGWGGRSSPKRRRSAGAPRAVGPPLTPPAATVRISPTRHHPAPCVSAREGFAMTKDGE